MRKFERVFLNQMERNRVIISLWRYAGGPCCGKTTQCAKIAKDFGYNHLSAAELVRNEMNKGTVVGKKCDHLIQDGEPMPLQLVLGVLKQAINKDVNSKGFLIDGFPRANGQAKELISAFEKKVVISSFTKYF